MLMARSAGNRLAMTFTMLLGIVAVDNELFVCDYSFNCIQVLSIADGRFVRPMGADQMYCPTGIAFDPNTRLLPVTEEDNVSVWSLDGQRLHSWGSDGSQPGQFVNVSNAITVAADGTVYVADGVNHRIQVF